MSNGWNNQNLLKNPSFSGIQPLPWTAYSRAGSDPVTHSARGDLVEIAPTTGGDIAHENVYSWADYTVVLPNNPLAACKNFARARILIAVQAYANGSIEGQLSSKSISQTGDSGWTELIATGSLTAGLKSCELWAQ
jgi:hypothetical protein